MDAVYAKMREVVEAQKCREVTPLRALGSAPLGVLWRPRIWQSWAVAEALVTISGHGLPSRAWLQEADLDPRLVISGSQRYGTSAWDWGHFDFLEAEIRNRITGSGSF